MMMRGLSFLCVLTVVTPAVTQSVPPGTYASAADLKSELEQLDPAAMVVARIENTELTRVNLIHRTIPQNAIIHATGWEVHHITDGSGTIVTGGQVVRSTDSSGATVVRIEDGDARQVGPGDVIIVPPGTPHWYSDIKESVTYLEIRYDPGKE